MADETHVKVDLNSPGFRAWLRSEEALALCKGPADKIAAAAGDGMEVFTNIGPNRARAAVVTTTVEAMLAEANDGALSSAIDAGRG